MNNQPSPNPSDPSSKGRVIIPEQNITLHVPELRMANALSAATFFLVLVGVAVGGWFAIQQWQEGSRFREAKKQVEAQFSTTIRDAEKTLGSAETKLSTLEDKLDAATAASSTAAIPLSRLKQDYADAEETLAQVDSQLKEIDSAREKARLEFELSKDRELLDAKDAEHLRLFVASVNKQQQSLSAQKATLKAVEQRYTQLAASERAAAAKRNSYARSSSSRTRQYSSGYRSNYGGSSISGASTAAALFGIVGAIVASNQSRRYCDDGHYYHRSRKSYRYYRQPVYYRPAYRRSYYRPYYY